MKLFINVSSCFDEELCSWEKETLMGVSMLSCPGQKYINTSVSSLDQFETGYLSLFTALIRADNVSE